MGVDLGQGHKNNRACASFVEYIALDQHQTLVEALSHANFYSLQADGSTDCGNVKDELYFVACFDPHTADRKAHT